jgi:hypothetical protein
MKPIILVIVLAALAGCGVDTATTAAAVAAAKKQDIEQGKKTMEQMQQDIGKSMEQARQKTERTEEAVKY